MPDRNATGRITPRIPGKQDWRYATHAGARLAMLERARSLTIRERLEEMQALNELAERLRSIRGGGAR